VVRTMAALVLSGMLAALLVGNVTAPAPKPCPQLTGSGGAGTMEAGGKILSPCPSGPVKFTYLGGSSAERGYAVAYDAAGNVFVAGFTSSPEFPTTPGAYDRTLDGSDMFVAKFDPNMTALLASTFFGGSGSDSDTQGLAVDSEGSVYISGTTRSTDLPTTPGAWDTTYGGGSDAVLAKFDSALSTLLYSTYLGGSLDDRVEGLAVDSSGSAYLAGSTSSVDFPASSGAYDTTHVPDPCGDGCERTDVFVTKINPVGGGPSDLVYSTFIGGVGGEFARDIAVDTSGNAYITGSADSANYPTTPGAYDTSWSGGVNAFITKPNPGGTGLVYSTFLGPSETGGTGIAIDTSGNAYVTGVTGKDFPTTPGAFDTTYNGNPYTDAFVTKLNAGGSALVYSTYLGGKQDDSGSGVAVDSDGTAYVVGDTKSSNFPVTSDGFDASYNGNGDTFLTRLNSGGSGLVYSSFIGGSGDDTFFATSVLTVDASGNVYLAGTTQSSNFPVSSGAYDTFYNGGYDAFAGRLA